MRWLVEFLAQRRRDILDRQLAEPAQRRLTADRATLEIQPAPLIRDRAQNRTGAVVVPPAGTSTNEPALVSKKIVVDCTSSAS